MSAIRIFSLFLIFILAAVSCGKPANGKKNGKSKDPEWAELTTGRIATYLEETGEVTPRSIVKVKVEFTGRVSRIYREQGDPVREGERMALVYPDVNQIKVYSTAEINYQRNANELSQLSNELAEAESLFKDGLISKNRYDTLMNSFRISTAELDKSRLELESLRSAGAISEGQGVFVKAPINGTVLKRLVEIGDFVIGASSYQSGTVLFEIADIRNIIVQAQINEMDILNVREGAQAEVTLEALPDKTFQGRIFRIFPTPEVKDSVKKYTVQVELTASLPPNARPGMSCRIRVLTVEKKGVPVLPVSAVMRDERRQKDYCLIKATNATDTKKYQTAAVKTGARDENNVEILSGLNDGDKVIRNPYSVPESEVIPAAGDTNAGSGPDKRPRRIRM